MEQLAILQNATPAQQEAAAMHYEIIEAAKAAATSLLDLGRKLKRMRDTGLYKELGFSSFGDYTEAAVNIRQRQAYYYIQVVEGLPARLIEENAAAGVTKLALLAKLWPDDREEVLKELDGDLAHITVSELQKLVDEKNGLAEQLSLFHKQADQTAPIETESVEVDIEEVKRQTAAEVRRSMEQEWARERTRLESDKATAVSAATAKAEKAAAEAIRKVQASARKTAAEETARQVQTARQEAAKEAAQQQRERDQAELDASRRREAEAMERAEKTAKQLQLGHDEDGIRFVMLFDQMRDKVTAMQQLADTMRQKGNSGAADKYIRALSSALEALRLNLRTDEERKPE